MLDTPLIVIPDRESNTLRDNDGHYIGTVDQDAQAAEVVKRCNAYPELIALLAQMSEYVFWTPEDDTPLPQVYNKARALLDRLGA